MAVALPILAGVGIGMQAVGTIAGASARSDAAAKDAELKNQQADELLRRAGVVEGDIRRTGAQVEGEQRLAAGRGNISADSGILLSALESTQHNIDRQTAEMHTQAAFNAEQLRKGADASMQLSSNEFTAGLFSGGGSLLTGSYNLGKSQGWWTPKTATQPLTAPGPVQDWSTNAIGN